MSPSFYAHSGSAADGSDWQLLAEHLSKVGERAAALARTACEGDRSLAEAAYAAGLFHDLGKYRIEWQQYLQAAVKGIQQQTIPHAIHGAAVAADELHSPAVALAIAGHHAGLYDASDLGSKLEREGAVLAQQVEEIRVVAKREIPSWPKPLAPLEGNDAAASRRYEFWTRVLFSLLVDADRLDTERHSTGRERQVKPLEASVLLDRLEKARADRSSRKPADKLTELRNRVFAECRRQGAVQEQGFFSLTVPTGGGKTLSSMAFGLAHTKRYGLRRIIVVIPYLSIIEQNAKEYKSLFGSENVVEHHSATEDEKRPLGERPTRTPAELATENWDAPVIVTTSVQFLESLLAASPRRCRKLHNIARSVVIFDEVQAMPTHLLQPLLSVFRELVDHFGVSMVFSTATQPAFRRSASLPEGLRPGELQPILPETLETELFTELRRVRYHRHLSETWDWSQLAERLTACPQALCVLNTRAHARTAWEAVRTLVRQRHGDAEAQGVLHLSSAMCAQHRLDVLGDRDKPRKGSIRQRLSDREPCWVCSTQVIEAGVDVDFPEVYRALGPLDSVVQVAGRCNREGLLRDAAGTPCLGNAHVFLPCEVGMPPGVYATATGLAKTFLGEVSDEQLACDPTLFQRYFSELFGRIPTDHEVRGQETIQESRADWAFARVAERARVIEDGGRGVLVPYGKGKERISVIRKKKRFTWRTLRRLQRFMVNLRPRDLEALRKFGQLQPLLPDQEEILVLDDGSYDPRLGVLIDGRPAEDFIQ